MEKHLNSGFEFSTLHIGSAICGIPILEIQEINKNFDITPVPQSSDYIRGIQNLRGQIVTIIDLGLKLGLAPVRSHRENKNIIVNVGDEPIGLMVDAIDDVLHADSTDIGPVPANIGAIRGRYFKGVVKRKHQLIGILDIEALFEE
jgi:purine-binding chemotaxis protein CheW